MTENAFEGKINKKLKEVETCWNGMLGLIQSGEVGFGGKIQHGSWQEKLFLSGKK